MERNATFRMLVSRKTISEPIDVVASTFQPRSIPPPCHLSEASCVTRTEPPTAPRSTGNVLAAGRVAERPNAAVLKTVG